MLPKENRIRKTSEFNLVFKQSKRIETEHFKIYSHFNNNPEDKNSKLGIVTSAKVGTAVVRNRVRRQIKAILKDKILSSSEPIWIVIMVRSGIGKLTFSEIKKELSPIL